MQAEFLMRICFCELLIFFSVNISKIEFSKHPFLMTKNSNILIFSKTLVKWNLFLACRSLFLFIAFEPKHWERSTPGQHDWITTHACAHTHAILSAFLAKVNRNHGTPTPQVLLVMRHGLLDFTTRANSLFRNYKFFWGGHSLASIWQCYTRIFT